MGPDPVGLVFSLKDEERTQGYEQREDNANRHKKKTAIYKPKRGLEQTLPQSHQRAGGPANTSILNFKPPELWDNRFLLLKPPRLGYCVRQPGQTRAATVHDMG